MSIPNLTVINGSLAGKIFKDENYVDSNGYRRMDAYFPWGGITTKLASAGDNAIGYNPTTQIWKDFGQDGATNPKLLSSSTDFTSATDEITNPEFIHIQSGNGTYMGYLTNHDYSSGPTVTSITSGYIVTDDTVSNTDFTLLKNGSAYANTNISLTAATIDLPSGAQVAGYTYTLQYDGSALYGRTIDSKSYDDFYYDDSWTSNVSGAVTGRQTNSNRILNVLGKIPNLTSMTYSTTIWNAAAPTRSSDDRLLSVRFYKMGSNAYPATELFVYFYVYGTQNDIKAKFAGYRYEGTTLLDYDVSNEFTIGAQEWMSHNFSDDGHNQIVEIKDWVYSDEPEGSGYVAPVTTSSNEGGKRRRYPIISTNLFDRQRSIYSIGNTHKDETLF